MPRKTAQQYILLPPRGISASDVATANAFAAPFLLSLEAARIRPGNIRAFSTAKFKTRFKVLDSVHEDGAKLVELSSDSVSALQAEQPGIRIVPVVYYYPAIARPPRPAAAPKTARASLGLSLTVVSEMDESPIAGADVIAFVDFANKTGSQGVTNKNGVVNLQLGGTKKKVERLYVYATGGFWNALREDVMLTSGMKVELTPIDLSYTDALRHFYGNSPDTAGQNVTVGVIDTGVGPHRDLTVAGGENTVSGEDPADYTDNGLRHGTHVAGIIAAKGSPPNGIRGLAPAAVLRGYRVFGKGSEGASNFAIIKAIDRAVADGCDLINMSLGGAPKDEATHSAIADARAKGCLVIVASGNDGRQPVSYPASDSLALAVSALGRKGTFPAATTQLGEVEKPFGDDKANFIAAFSNVGPEIILTGPGVGIISTVPNNKYAVMDGTSMACPAVTGAAAKLLAANPAVLAQARDQGRSDAMAQIVLQAAVSLGFPATLEGRGLIRV